MKTHEQKKPTTALMFSGGMDSYLAFRLFKPDHLVFCATGHRYQKREVQAIEQLGLRGTVIVDRSLNLGGWERDDAIVPLRNLMFAAVGSRYADTVWLGSLLGEVNWDKTPEFYWTTSAALSHCYRTSYWCEGRTVSVCSPTATMTKSKLLWAAMHSTSPVTRQEVGRTVSCYSDGGFCGGCPSCFKRAVATKLNGWVEDYAVNPFDTHAAYSCLVKAVQGGYPKERGEEIMRACEYDGDILAAIDKLKEIAGRSHRG